MCKNCLKEPLPDRGSCCLETGTYLMNYAGCVQCRSCDVVIREKTCHEEEDEETITYKHVCEGCGHLIAVHEYTFSVNDMYQVWGEVTKYLTLYPQEYSMNCTLCGYGNATVSILPDDPREKQLF